MNIFFPCRICKEQTTSRLYSIKVATKLIDEVPCCSPQCYRVLLDQLVKFVSNLENIKIRVTKDERIKGH